jgi:hypothetical protein
MDFPTRSLSFILGVGKHRLTCAAIAGEREGSAALPDLPNGDGRRASVPAPDGEASPRLHSETPVPNLSTEDSFGHEDYASAAATTLVNAETPFTLGVFGDWGIGKTTIIREIGRRVRKQGLAYVEFDVWRYEGQALRRQFLREVAVQLKAAGQLRRKRVWRGYSPRRELQDLEVDIPVPKDHFRFSPRSLLVAAAHGAVLFVGVRLFLDSSLPAKIWGKVGTGASSADRVAFVIAMIGFVYSLLSQIFRVEQRFITVRRIEEPERFEAKFREILSLTKSRRVVVAIDNLDRCSPKLVDTFLATIKTYLEPAAARQEKRPAWRRAPSAVAEKLRLKKPSEFAEAVFVIAADEAAVRRHMTARELEESPPRLTMGESDGEKTLSSDRERLQEAEYQVDEYLRKFFNATIRVRPLLPEDVRGYAQQQLTEFFRKHTITAHGASDSTRLTEQEARDRLVTMVAGALRKNPRRIKQFVHNLDARLETIEAREASKRIRPPISDDVLGIAKVAIIEEEWRDTYEQLEVQPRKLAQWQEQVWRGDLPDNESLSAFLRATRDIVPKNVGAIVNLKLESDDLTLPDFGDFREAVANAEFTNARRVIELAPAELASEYSARLPEFLRQEISRNAFPEARNVLDAALQDPPLGDPAVRRPMLYTAVAQPSLVSQLPALEPERLFPVLDQLTPTERRTARQPFVNLAALLQFGQDTVRKVCIELASRVKELDQREREQLQNAIAVDPHASQLRPSYITLVEADPTLLTEAAVDSAFRDLGTADLSSSSPEFHVVTLGFSVGLGETIFNQFLGRLLAQFSAALGDADQLRAVREPIIQTLTRLKRVRDAELQEFIAQLHAQANAVLAVTPGMEGVKFLLDIAGIADTLDASAEGSIAEAEALAQAVVTSDPVTVAGLLKGMTE